MTLKTRASYIADMPKLTDEVDRGSDRRYLDAGANAEDGFLRRGPCFVRVQFLPALFRLLELR